MRRYRWLMLAFFLVLSSAVILAAAKDRVRIEEWSLPTPDSFPHDPAVGADGSLWYTGMKSNTLGRLDPETGEIKEYSLQTPNSGAHGLVADKDGNIWFTAMYKGYIGKLDPRNGAVTEYPLPDLSAGDPHTPVFDQKGILWFTVLRGNFVGRLDPRTGIITLKPSPTPNSRPYGIAVNSKGIPFFTEFGTNKLASVAPNTMEITEYTLPHGARPRRIAITPDDMVYYTNFPQGHLGRLDPQTGKVEEWPSPGGNNSAPYGMTATPDGKVWYSESGLRPNTMVRFDPATQTFESWPVPSGGGVIRHMVAPSRKELFFAGSGVNKVGIVRIEHAISAQTDRSLQY